MTGQVLEKKEETSERAYKPGTAPRGAWKRLRPGTPVLPLTYAALRLRLGVKSSVRRRGPVSAEALLASRLPRRRLNADYCRARNYGISRARYDALVIASHGRCGICARVDDGSGPRGLVVDHDHRSGVVRGLICGPCNRAIHFLERYGYGLDWMGRALTHIKRARRSRRAA